MARNKEKQRAAQRRYNARNRAKINAWTREWVKRNPEKMREIQRRSELKSKYGISVEEYNRLFQEQDGRCAVCLRHQTELGLRLAVDHDHETGDVRALLCGNCNTALGLVNDSPELLEKLAAYVKKYGKDR